MSETVQLAGGNYQLDQHPNHCPICHRLVVPRTQYGFVRGVNNRSIIELEVVYLCPNGQCLELFIAYFDPNESGLVWKLRECKPRSFEAREFDDSIKEYSRTFCEIYNEARAAENARLKHICGVGYRKAFEFPLKDYLIKQRPEDKSSIARTQLGACIENYVSDLRIKDVAKRAAWLGNDETHYERRWRDMDLSNLKQMIDLTLYWIQMETLTRSTLASMPQQT
jgi:hypothetical protein